MAKGRKSPKNGENYKIPLPGPTPQSGENYRKIMKIVYTEHFSPFWGAIFPIFGGRTREGNFAIFSSIFRGFPPQRVPGVCRGNKNSQPKIEHELFFCFSSLSGVPGISKSKSPDIPPNVCFLGFPVGISQMKIRSYESYPESYEFLLW